MQPQEENYEKLAGEARRKSMIVRLGDSFRVIFFCV